MPLSSDRSLPPIIFLPSSEYDSFIHSFIPLLRVISCIKQKFQTLIQSAVYATFSLRRANMKYIAPFFALVAAVLAQNNAINIPAGGLQVTAGQPITITWTDPSSSTVTIKLQQGSGVTPNSGITVLSEFLPISCRYAS